MVRIGHLIWQRFGALPYPRRWLGLYGLVLFVVFLRGQSTFLYPTLPVEDGGVFWQHFIHERAPSAVFYFYQGYIALVPNLVSYGVAALPATWAPYLMSLFALLMTALSYSLFALRRFRFLVPSDRTRVLVCFTLVLLPLGNYRLLGATAYTNFHLLWLLILLGTSPQPRARRLVAVQLLVLALAVWSHPLSFVMLPIYLYYLLARHTWRDRVVNGVLFLVTAGYLMLGIEPGSASVAAIIAGVPMSVFVGLERVVFEPLAGNEVRVYLLQHGLFVPLYAVAIALLLAGLLLARSAGLSRREKGYLLGVFGLMAVLTVLAIGTRGRHLTGYYIGEYQQRYYYLQQMMFLMVSVCLVARWLEHHRPGRATRLLAACVLAGYLLLVNVANVQWFRTPVEEGVRVQRFLEEVEGVTRGGTASGGELVLERETFPIVVRPDDLAARSSRVRSAPIERP